MRACFGPTRDEKGLTVPRKFYVQSKVVSLLTAVAVAMY